MMHINAGHRQVPLVESFEFSTPLSIEECRERLERSAARTIEFRANVRVSQWGFVAEVQLQYGGRGQIFTIAELFGSLRPQAAGTLIKAEVVNTNPVRRSMSKAPFPAAVIFLMGLYFATDRFERVSLNAVLFSLVVSGCTVLVVLLVLKQRSDFIDRHIPDLREWLHTMLDAAPNTERA